MDSDFWQALDNLVESSVIRIDRPKGSRHPRYPDQVYPLDYGYLEDTSAMDSGGVDVWRGSLKEAHLHGVLVSVDLSKRDVELKLLLGCTLEEMDLVMASSNRGQQTATLIVRQQA